jgi:hypothetical protein
MHYPEYRFDDIDSVISMIEGGLSYREMDLTNTYCPQGCCRVLQYIPFGDHYCASGAAVMRVLGLRAGEEVDMRAFLRVYTHDQTKERKVIYNPTDDPWAKWRVTQGEAETDTD